MFIKEDSMRKLVIVGLASLVLALLPVVQAQAVTSTFLNLTGQPGDFVLGGQTRTFTPDTATFFESYDGSLLQVNVNTPASPSSGRSSSPLRPGRHSSQEPT
jgi:hypothetical protein